MKISSLVTYLNDHLGLLAGEIELAERMRRENERSPLAEFLDRYVDEVTAQGKILEETLATLGCERSLWKKAAGWLAEKVGRLKPNNSLVGYSPLSRLVELEALLLAAQSRQCLWSTMTGGAVPQIPAFDFDGLQRQAREQLVEIETHRQAAVEPAFAD